MTQQQNDEFSSTLETMIADAVQAALGNQQPPATTTGPVATPSAQPTADDLENLLQHLDPRDSEAALLMLNYLIQTKRLGRVGVLDGGQGYLFLYEEPKGSSKAGYKPGATQGDRIVDEALKAQQAAGHGPQGPKGMCPHCYSVVVKDEATGKIALDDESAETHCEASLDGSHGIA